MKVAPLEWARANAAAYFGNATAVRDYRIQLRGSKAAVLWSIYLLILIASSLAVYADAASAGQISVVEAQSKLRGFYQVIIMLLAGMVCLVAPALTATAVVIERQRRSLDLLFSAPVSPKYYLVGKMISSYRYTWMLLILSLPVTATCVVLGGASWSDVLSSYMLLSLDAIVLTAISLLISTFSPKPVGAILLSYLLSAVYLGVITPLLGLTRMSAMGSALMGGGREAPFVISLNPFVVVQTASTYTTMWGVHVPNWILVGLYSLLVAKIMLVGAASLLSYYGSPETRSLRIHGIVYFFLLSMLIAWPLGMSVPTANFDQITSLSVTGVALFMTLGVPIVVCYGRDLERKFWPDGVFSLGNAIKGTPSGALPYLLMLVAASTAGAATAIYLGVGRLPGPLFWLNIGWLSCFTFFCWAAGRFTSSFVNGLRAARMLHFLLLIAVFILPLPLVASLDPRDGSDFFLWQLTPTHPVMGSLKDTAGTFAHAGALLLGGWVMFAVSEKWARIRFGRMVVTDE